MWSLKTILLELFLQAHDMIVLGYKANELNIMFNFPMYQIIWIKNAMLLHLSKAPMCMICWGERNWRIRLRLGQLLGIFFLHDYKWTKHFCVDRTFVQHVTKIKTFHGEEHQVSLHYAHECFCHLHLVQISACMHACIRIFALFGILLLLRSQPSTWSLHGLMCVVNFIMKNQVKWPKGNDLIEIMDGFKKLCGLSSIHGAIDVPHIHV